MTTHDDAEVTAPREKLLGRVADLILERGVADLSLSLIARDIGSNNRMLLYYFGSKEELLNEATLEAFTRFPHIDGMLERLRSGDGSPQDRLLRAWDDIAHPDNRPFLALFFEAFGIALHQASRNQTYFARISTVWVPDVRDMLVDAGLDDAEAPVVATQIVATWRGLQFALLAGTPRQELDAAHRAMIARILP